MSAAYRWGARDFDLAMPSELFTFKILPRDWKQHRERRLKREEWIPGMPILVVSMQDEMHYAERVLKAGARGYAMKNWNGPMILQAVEAVYQGKVWLSDQFRNRIIERMIDDSNAGSSHGMASLSDRELMVFRMIGAGLKKSDIARRLNLSPNTIETYRSHLKQKLNVETGAELTRIAFLQLQEEGGHQSKEPFLSGV